MFKIVSENSRVQVPVPQAWETRRLTEQRTILSRSGSRWTESILDELRRVAALLPPGPITREDFNAVARMSEATIRQRFGGWQAALERASLTDRFSKPGAGVSAEEVLADLRRVATVVGREQLMMTMSASTGGRRASVPSPSTSASSRRP